MEREYVLALVGLILIISSLIYLQSQLVYGQMPCYLQGGTQSYTPYILLIFGIFLVGFPFVKPFLKSRANLQSEKPDEKQSVIEMVEKLLNDDEAKILKIIYENEGITQDSLHFRTGFSHSKISMIIKKLEEKGLIVRERFGRTYKLYPSEQFGKI